MEFFKNEYAKLIEKYGENRTGYALGVFSNIFFFYFNLQIKSIKIDYSLCALYKGFGTAIFHLILASYAK